jgi:hypothetical protein
MEEDCRMATKDLENFLREIQNGHSRAVDVEGTKREWLGGIEKLYAQIEQWLDPLRRQGLVKVARTDFTIREETLGTYSAPGLEIEAGGRKISVEPIARVVFGGSGRVDMGHGPLSRVLIRAPKETGEWIISARSPSDGGRELNEDTFSEALQSLLA